MISLVEIIKEIEVCDARIKRLKERIESMNKDFDLEISMLKSELERSEQYRSQWIEFIELNELIKLNVGDLLDELCSLTNADPKKVYVSTSNDIRYYPGDQKRVSKQELLYEIAMKNNGVINNITDLIISLKNDKKGEKFSFDITQSLDFGSRLTDDAILADNMRVKLEYDEENKVYYQTINVNKKIIKKIILNLKYEEISKDETGLLKNAILNHFKNKEDKQVDRRK